MTFKTEVPQRCQLLLLKDKPYAESAVAFHRGKCEAASNKARSNESVDEKGIHTGA